MMSLIQSCIDECVDKVYEFVMNRYEYDDFDHTHFNPDDELYKH